MPSIFACVRAEMIMKQEFQLNAPFFAFHENIETNLNIRHFFHRVLQQTRFPTSPEVENDDKARCEGRILLSIQLKDET
jgi:hypothetical protein